jgi:hypothetical protein
VKFALTFISDVTVIVTGLSEVEILPDQPVKTYSPPGIAVKDKVLPSCASIDEGDTVPAPSGDTEVVMLNICSF